MKTKQVWTLLVIFLVLGVGTFIRQMQKPAQLAVREYSPLDLTFKEENVQKIILERTWESEDEIKPSQKVELVRTGTEWRLPGFFDARVNPKKIEEFFRQTRKAEGEQRAAGKKFFKDFGIEDAGSFRVSFYEGGEKPSLEFLLGTKSASSSFFVRKAGSDVIYLTGANFFAQMGIYADPAKENLFPEQWAAKDFLKPDPAKVLALQIKSFDKGKETVKADLEFLNGSWKSKKSSTAISSQKVTGFLAADWQAKKVIAAESKDFSKPVWQMNLTTDNGTKVLKAIKEEKSGEIFLTVEGEKTAYEISSDYFDGLNKDEAAFAAPAKS